MGDEAHVGLVDAHAEGDGRDHHHAVLLQKDVLVARPVAGLHAGVIGERVDSFTAQERRELLGRFARAAIDDAAVAAMRGDEAQELAAAVAARAHGETQVRPVEAVDEQLGRACEQPGGDIAARRLVGGRGEGDGLGDAERVAKRCEVHVIGAEVVAPLRDAVRLVDREHRGLRGAEHRHHLRLGEPFRRDVGEPQFAPRDLFGDVAVLGKIVGRIERGGGDAVALELRHLVAHQRDQRRDDDGEPVAHQRRKLIAQRFAAAGRHDREHVAAGEDGGDDLRLAVAEGGEAEHAAQQFMGGVEVAPCSLPVFGEGQGGCLWPDAHDPSRLSNPTLPSPKPG